MKIWITLWMIEQSVTIIRPSILLHITLPLPCLMWVPMCQISGAHIVTYFKVLTNIQQAQKLWKMFTVSQPMFLRKRWSLRRQRWRIGGQSMFHSGTRFSHHQVPPRGSWYKRGDDLPYWWLSFVDFQWNQCRCCRKCLNAERILYMC